MKDREAWGVAVHGSQRVRHDLVTEQENCRALHKPQVKYITALTGVIRKPSQNHDY